MLEPRYCIQFSLPYKEMPITVCSLAGSYLHKDAAEIVSSLQAAGFGVTVYELDKTDEFTKPTVPTVLDTAIEKETT